MKYGLTEDWKNIKELVIYGFGKVAHDNMDFFRQNFNILYIIDMMFYTAVSGKCEISRGILDGFYFDNDFVGGREVGLEI